MQCVRDPFDKLPPLGAPIREAKPAPAPVPTGTPGIVRNPDGRLGTALPLPKEPAVAPTPPVDPMDEPICCARLPEILCRNVFVGCVGEPNGPREVHEDRWFFKGGDDEGYDTEEEAEDARTVMFAPKAPTMVVDGVRYAERASPGLSCVGCAFYCTGLACDSTFGPATEAFGATCIPRTVIYIRAEVQQ